MPASPADLPALNALDARAFTAALGDLFEHSPWIAERVAGQRPFADARALHDAMMDVVLSAPLEQQLALIAAHPELAGSEASAGTLTADSSSEQSRLGLDRLSPEAHARLGALNQRYRTHFGFPCIIALRQHATNQSVFAAFEQRLGHARDVEIALALEQISLITRGRLASRLGLASARLSLHALDTAEGIPARGLRFVLCRNESGVWQQLIAGETNADGRTAAPLLSDLDVLSGVYRLDFHVGAYHSQRHPAGADPIALPFLDIVPIVFGIADPASAYHVPLLFTRWGYSTYRGS